MNQSEFMLQEIINKNIFTRIAIFEIIPFLFIIVIPTITKKVVNKMTQWYEAPT